MNQNPSTTHRLAIVGYSLDSISGHFIIQLGQLSHRTPQKRGLQSNWKLHTGPGGDTERGLAVVTPLSFFQLVVVRWDFERKVIGKGGYHYMFGTTCVFMKLMECIWVGEGFNLVSGHGGKKNRGSEEWGGGNSKLWEENGTEEYTWGNNEEESILEKRGETEKCNVKGRREGAQLLIKTQH